MNRTRAIKRVIVSLCLLMAFMATTFVHASQSYLQFSVPARQGWYYTAEGTGSAYITSQSANYATVYGEAMTNEAITFYAGHYNTDTKKYTYNSVGAVLYKVDTSEKDMEVNVSYGANYAKGQLMGMKVRNHNWTLSKGEFAGVVDYH